MGLREDEHGLLRLDLGLRLVLDLQHPLLVQNFLQHAATLAGAAGALEA